MAGAGDVGTVRGMVSRFMLFTATASLAAALPGVGWAGRPELPCRVPIIEQERHIVVDRDRLIDVQLGDKKFRVPYAYFYARPFASHLNCDPKLQPLTFAFWMPDLRPTQRDMWYVPSYRPHEEGRPEPHAGERGSRGETCRCSILSCDPVEAMRDAASDGRLAGRLRPKPISNETACLKRM